MTQLHKRFTDQQVKDLMYRYLRNELKRTHIQEILKIGKRQFFKLLKEYRENPDKFSIQYERAAATRTIPQQIEQNIIKELTVAKEFIDNKAMPIWSYNYSFIKNELKKRFHQSVSVPTIIAKAKKYGFYIGKPAKKKAHDREVITNNVGELIQHDSSWHLWSPYSKYKWWLITSIDDYSRFMFYAMLVLRDATLAHIRALQTVFLKYGLPLSFYVDCDSVFKFIRGRDELHYKHYLQTDETNPQWKQVCQDCQVKIINALSPQAKGKVERPYRWIQDHLVRICAREKITTIAPANQILFREVHEYNYKRIHSTTGEIPYLRYQRALRENKNVLRKFLIPPPYQSIKDIFCFRFKRTVDAYRTVSINNLKLKFNNALIHEEVNLRIYPYTTGGLSEVRFWYKDKLLDIQKAKTELLLPVHF
jgi:hypothetical protein